MRTIRRVLWVWWLYFITIPGIPKLFRRQFGRLTHESVGSSQWVLVQAFGRSSYSDKGLVSHLSELFANVRPTVFRFSRLYNAGFNPGLANLKLAEHCDWLWGINPDLVLELQWEVAYCLWLRDKTRFVRKQKQVNAIWPGGSYFATYHVAELAAHDIRLRGLDPRRGIDLAHPDMVVRALPIAWRQGLDPLPWVTDVPFAGPDSIQPWTRAARPWFVRETLTRVHHLAHMLLRRQIMAIKPPAVSS